MFVNDLIFVALLFSIPCSINVTICLFVKLFPLSGCQPADLFSVKSMFRSCPCYLIRPTMFEIKPFSSLHTFLVNLASSILTTYVCLFSFNLCFIGLLPYSYIMPSSGIEDRRQTLFNRLFVAFVIPSVAF